MFHRTVAIFLVSVCCLASVAARADDRSSDDARSTDLPAALATGEFSRARAQAATLAPHQRDAALTEIAEAQMRAGGSVAAAATIAAVGDDRARHRLVEQLFAYETESGPFTPAGGGGPQPDFDSLIELVTSTIRQADWVVNGGTIGQIAPHEGGIFVDAGGVVRPQENSEETARLAALRRESARNVPPGGARRTSTLRKVSLPRLERELQLRRALRRPYDEEMETLAGLQRITHVLVYPDSGDVVLAGPAGDWYLGRENRYLSVETDRPVVRLSDLITLLRREFSSGGYFSVSIEPTSDGLLNVQSFMEQSRTTPLTSGELPNWTAALRNKLGRQNVLVRGVDPQSRVAQTMVEADYRMKLVGIEREPGTTNVRSYFDLVRASGREPTSMGLLRWWFTVHYHALLTSPARDVFELRGQGVQLQSENEFLSDRGERVPTGSADDVNRQFAEEFTTHFAEIAQKYPVYAELQNLFDLAVVCAVLKNERVCERTGWRRLGIDDPNVVRTSLGAAPTSVESVANATMVSKSRVMAVISGGVRIDVAALADSAAIHVDDRERLAKERRSAAPQNLPTHGWWWD